METGRQLPRILLAPEIFKTYGDDACYLAEAYGMKPDEWQADILNVWLAEDERGQYAAMSCGLSVPRQNGKNAIVEMRELYGAAVLGETILHTAHRVDTARKAFLRLAGFFEDIRHPEMIKIVKTIRRTNGQEEIELTNGGSVSFSSRVNGGKRGFTADVVVFDEAQELTDDQMEAIMSTMAASPKGKRQLIYTGTPPTPVSPGTVFKREREAAISKTGKKQSWHEWSIENLPSVHSWDTIRELCYEVNPAMGIRLDDEFTEKEYRTLSFDGFARERLGWWSNTSNEYDTCINADAWDACTNREPKKEGLVCYGVKFAPDGSTGSLAACYKPADGVPFVYVVDNRSMSGGLQWFADTLYRVHSDAAQIVVDGQSNAQALIDKLLAMGVPSRTIIRPRTPDVIAAHAWLLNAVKEKQITHYGQEGLNLSATRSRKRRIGQNGGWGFQSTDEADATLIESVALAYWGAMTTKRKPGRKAVVL